MNCQTASLYTDDYLDDMLEEATQNEFQEHLEACPDCQRRLADEQALRSALKALPSPVPDPEFAASVFKRAVAAQPSRPWINTSAVVRIAASILVIIALGVMVRGFSLPERSEWREAFVRVNQAEEIRLVFRSTQDLDGVTLRLKPQDGVNLVGYENQREVVWQANLNRGENLLVLPVIVRNLEGGTLIAEIRHGNQSKQFNLRIKVIQPEDQRQGTGKSKVSQVTASFT